MPLTLEEELDQIERELGSAVEVADRWQLRCERIDVLGRLGRIGDADTAAEEMLDEVPPDEPWFGEVLRHVATLAMLSGTPEQAREILTRAVAWERERRAPLELAQALSSYAMAVAQCGDVEAAHAAMDESVMLRRELDDRPALADGLRRLAGMEYLKKRPRRSAVYAEEAARLFRELGDETGIAISLYQLGIAYSEIGDNDRARESLEQALAIDGANGDAMRATVEQTVLAVVEFECGNSSRALELLDSAQRAQEEGGLRWYLALTLVNRGMIEHARAQLTDAMQSFRRAAALAEETQNERVVTLARFHEAAIHAELGRTEEAQALIEGRAADPADAEVVALLQAMIAMGTSQATGAKEPAARAARLFYDNASGDPKADPVPAHWRIVSGMVEAYLTRCGGAVGKATLVATPGGKSFRVPGGDWVEMGRKPILRTLFAALLHQRLEAPGAPLSAEELAAAAWPDARFDEAMANRLYVSLSKLRDLGLRDVLLNQDGYLLDPGYAVQLDGPAVS